MADTETAIAAIDDWAIEACGDFCARWPEFEYILRYEEQFDPGIWENNLDRYLQALDAGGRLVPDAVRDEWDVAVDIQRRRMQMFVDNGFRFDVDEATALAEWGVLPWDQAKSASDAALDTIQDWADTHCDEAVLTIGAPGTVAVRYTPQPELAGTTYLAVLLPAGVDFGDVRDVEDYEAAVFGGDMPPDMPPDMRPEDMPAMVLRPIDSQGEYFSEERAVVSGGAHELFVGAFQGQPGAYGLYFAAPDYCIQIPIGVNGTTVVDAPALEPCDLEPIGRDEEIARRTPPPEDGDGRLWIELPTALGRDGYDWCRIDAYLLPAGTTLNAVGSGDVWPVGTVNIHPRSGREASGPDRALADQPGMVPILAMPPSGTGEVMALPSLRPGSSWDAFFPDPIPLASGSYDLRVGERCVVEGTDSEDFWCGMTTVDVAGDTTVPLPELGECP